MSCLNNIEKLLFVKNIFFFIDSVVIDYHSFNNSSTELILEIILKLNIINIVIVY